MIISQVVGEQVLCYIFHENNYWFTIFKRLFIEAIKISGIHKLFDSITKLVIFPTDIFIYVSKRMYKEILFSVVFIAQDWKQAKYPLV